jgi:RNA polymerase sigma-70 factor (ECF subfamily)
MREAALELALVQRARSGDRAAFDGLVRIHFTAVYTVLFRLTGNHEDAEDLAQETFVRAWGSLAHYRADAAFATWVRRIAVHLAQDHHRSRLRRGASTALADEGGEGEPAIARAQEDVEPGELQRALSVALDRLPPRLRAAVVLRTLEEKEYSELAQLLGVKPATARMHVMQARRLLLRWLAPWLGGGER